MERFFSGLLFKDNALYFQFTAIYTYCYHHYSFHPTLASIQKLAIIDCSITPRIKRSESGNISSIPNISYTKSNMSVNLFIYRKWSFLNSMQRFEYGAFGILMIQFFNFSIYGLLKNLTCFLYFGAPASPARRAAPLVMHILHV